MSLEDTPLIASNNGTAVLRSSLGKEKNSSAEIVSNDDLDDGEVPHSIGSFGSFTLIMNNLTGPAMLGFPHLFQQAGIIPVVIGIVFVSIAASLCGTFLSDTIASIPGNGQFKKRVDFSAAFRLTVGESWYAVAEVLFLISCAVQACAALVASAQSVDGFLASFVFGRTYAIQIFPVIDVVSWSPEACSAGSESQIESGVEECTPFHGAGPLIFSLGFAITTAIFLPLGQGHLKETIGVQIFSFIFMIILLIQFTFEFSSRGLTYELPWFGTDITQLAGVILFNYAFSITVPAWLYEKHPDVSVNKMIWSSTSIASVLYVLFGVLGAMSFKDASENMLVLLTSSKVHVFTRFSAALFGVIIIGCGVPVFCVIIRNALEFNNVCSPRWASFWGAIMPYAVSWMLYQGSLLMSVLNWTGLVVNGLVAFLLPMILALKSTELRSHRRRATGVDLLMPSKPEIMITRETSQFAMYDEDSLDADGIELQAAQPNISSYNTLNNGDRNREGEEISVLSQPVSFMTSYGRDLEGTNRRSLLQARIHNTRVVANSSVEPLPIELEVYRREIVLFMILAFATIIVMTILRDILLGIDPSYEET